MNTKNKTTFPTLVAVVLAMTVGNHASASTSSFDGEIRPVSARSLNTTPGGFIPNVGQFANDGVKFTLRGNGVSAYFTEQGFVLSNGQTTTVAGDGFEYKVPVAPQWRLVGGKPVKPVGGEPFAHSVSYFRGNDPADWHANVPAFRDLRYPEILDGVELRVESRAGGFEYTFHVQPHAKADLRFRYEGITALEKNLLGDLIVRTAKGHLTESRPVSFQFVNGVKRDVASSFEIISPHEYRIAVGPYDERHELVIDPVLDWSTFLGGSSSVNLRDVKVDAAGNICVSGTTTAADLPVTAGFSTGPGVGALQDVVVAKFNASGTELLWLGYLGGAGATTEEVAIGNSLALDSAGNLLLVGFTESPDFPTTGGPLHAGTFDVFITKISHDGSAILRSSLLGGANADFASGMALDAQENLLVTGFSQSADFPTTVGAFDTTLGDTQDAFVMKFDAAGTLQWSSFLGGANGEERGAAIVNDANGDVVVSGDTGSSDFPVTAGALDTELGGSNDAFVAKIRSDGTAILWATFVGGSGSEHDLVSLFSPVTYHRGDLALDSVGNILIAGQTLSSDFPATSGAFQTTLAGDMDGYVAKLTPDGASLIWASYLGGSGGNEYQELIWGIALNPWDDVFLIGRTDSPNFPVTADAVQNSFPGGLQDGFLTKLSADGSNLEYSTYLGGSQNRDVALGIAYDSGNVLVAGWAASTSYPTTAGAYQTGCSSCGVGWADGVLMKFLDAFLVQDGFESGNYSGGAGWAGSWTTSGDVSILTSSGPHSGSRHVRLRRGTGLLSRTVNIPAGSTTLKLGFWSKVLSFEGTEHANVRVSANGGSLTTVHTLTSAQSDNTYHYYEIDLTSYVAASQIQIIFDANMGDVNDNWYLDDIRLTGTQGNIPPIANAGADQTVTDADSSGGESVTLDGTASSDPDGTITAYEWKQGATLLGNTATLNVNALLGTSIYTLTVTDNEGATSTDTVQIIVNTPTPPPANPLHCGDLDGTSSNSGKNSWKATVVVTMHDGNHAPVQGATVFIQWGGGASGAANLTTDANGRCTFTSGNISKSSPSATLSITGAGHATLTYSAANHDPDSDSNGTSIIVNKP